MPITRSRIPSTSSTRRSLRRILPLAFTLGIAAASVVAQQTPQFQERDFLTRIRRLTVEGRRAGEGYWSPDGKRIVFQSEREPGNPFYQIYTLDLGDRRHATHLARHGQDDVRVLPPRERRNRVCVDTRRSEVQAVQEEELAFRASGKERRYSWDYDPEMDIYAYSEKTGDTEATDDRARLRRRRQLFARRAVDRLLVDARRVQPAADRARAASSSRRTRATSPRSTSCAPTARDQKRLTNVPGYDGGPFFTHDGSRIVWRRFDEQGLIADVWTMNPDGAISEQITDFGAMSWAPYEHPSGEYFIFASNKLGFENFELFMVDVKGPKEPVRVTYSDGFDGLPVPSPDGTTARVDVEPLGRRCRPAVPRRSGITRRRSRRSSTRRPQSRARNHERSMTHDRSGSSLSAR